MGMWQIDEDGREPVTSVLLSEAEQYVEDRAVEIWSALRDPNDSRPQAFEGVTWRREVSDDARKPMTATYRNTTWRVHYVH